MSQICLKKWQTLIKKEKKHKYKNKQTKKKVSYNLLEIRPNRKKLLKWKEDTYNQKKQSQDKENRADCFRYITV